MLNLFNSFVSTLLSITLSAINYLKGPLLVGLIIGSIILSFTAEASAATVITTQCNWVGCPLWEGLADKYQAMLVCFVLACFLLFVLRLLED